MYQLLIHGHFKVKTGAKSYHRAKGKSNGEEPQVVRLLCMTRRDNKPEFGV